MKRRKPGRPKGGRREKSERVVLTMPPPLVRALEAKAKEEGLLRTELGMRFIEEALRQTAPTP